MSIEKKSLISTLKTTRKANIAKEEFSTPVSLSPTAKSPSGKTHLATTKGGAMLSKKGSMLTKKGSMLTKKGSMLTKKGSMLTKKGSMLTKKGTVLSVKTF